MDYYEYGARVLLERPLALVGFLGAGVRQVAHDLSARLGLPLHDVDRMTEHHAGQSLAALQIERGEAVRRAFEKRALAQALRGTPAGVIALGDGALLDRKSRRSVLAGTTLVFIERPLEVMQERLTRDVEREPGLHPELAIGGVPEEGTRLASMLAQRDAGYRAAPHHIDAGSLHATHVANLVIEKLALL